MRSDKSGRALVDIGNLSFISFTLAQPAALSTSQSYALNAYNKTVQDFMAILSERRAQINLHQKLPDVPGQALYLARISMMGAYKDLTDVLPSRIGRLNKFKIPPPYFDADKEPLIDEYKNLFAIMQAPPANAQNSEAPFEDVSTWAQSLRGSRASMQRMLKWRAASVSPSSLPRQTAIRT